MDFSSFLRSMQGASNSTEPEKYPDIFINPMLQSEKMFISAAGVPKNEIDAMIIANKAQSVLDRGEIEKARKMAIEAFELDPKSDDALRVIATSSNLIDSSGGAQALTEIVNMKRAEWIEIAKEAPGEFYNHAETRRFMRLLSDIAHLYENARHLDLACWALEECLRLNQSDNMGTRNLVLAMYIRIMGLDHLKVKCIKRGPKHIRGVINGKTPDGESIFENDNHTVRWAKLFLLWYEKSKDFPSRLKSEYSRSPHLARLFMGDIEYIPVDSSMPNIPGMPAGAAFGSSDLEKSRMVSKQLKDAFLTWPEFVVDMQKVLKPGKKPRVPDLPEFVQMYQEQQIVKSLQEGMLNTSRDEMRKGNVKGAFRSLSMCRGTHAMMAAFNRKRFTDVTPFAVFSNRATVDEAMGDIFECRFDSRCTLAAKPDHARTYERIPDLLEAFKAGALVDEADDLAREVEQYAKGQTTDEGWRAFAKRGIFLLSLRAIILSKLGKLTKKARMEIMETGIDDMYQSVNYPADQHPTLAWLTPEEMDPGL